MMKLKIAKVFLLITLASITLVGCGTSQSSTSKKPHNWTDVYNRSGKKVATFSKQKWINYFSDFPGKGHGNVKKSSLPAGSKLKFKYVLHQRTKNEKAILKIYSNKYASLSAHSHQGVADQDIPNLIWKLSSQTYNKVTNPKAFTK